MEQIEAVFLRNEITPSAAAEEFAELSARLRALDQSLGQLIEGMNGLHVGAEDLAPGEYEIGFLIPREAVDSELEHLGEEFVKLHDIVGPFLELGSGSRPDLQVRSISSSWFQVFLASPEGTALCLATAVERIVKLYKNLLDIRLAQMQLKSAGVPEEKTEGIKEYATTHMSTGIAKLVDELLDEFGAGLEDGRANELRIELRIAANGIANRIDRGYNVEVRVGELPPPPDEEAAEEPESEEAKEARRVADLIASKRDALEFMNLTGSPILELPEGSP